MTTFDERSATTHADSLRHRVTAGEPVSAAELAAAEAAERLEQLQREAAEQRAREDAERATTEQIENARADVQARWQRLHDPVRVAALTDLRSSAVEASLEWLRAAQVEADEHAALVDDATNVGFAVDAMAPAHLRQPLGQFEQAVRAAACGVVDADELDSLRWSDGS